MARAPEMHDSTSIALIVALKAEVPQFLERTSDVSGCRVQVLISGMGQDRARRATEELCASSRPDLLLHLGFCAGVQEGLSLGELVLARRVLFRGREIDADLELVAAAQVAAARVAAVGLYAHTGVLETRTWPVLSRRGILPEVLGVDMEAFAVVEAGRARGVPCLVAKVISDIPPMRIGYGTGRQLLGMMSHHPQVRRNLDSFARVLFTALAQEKPRSQLD
jgi:nucleoside phosphorylase